MNVLLFTLFSTLALIFLFIAGFSTKYQGFKLALILGALFFYLALIFR